MTNSERKVKVLLAGGFGHAVWVFDEWQRDDAPVELVGAVKTLPEESLDFFLGHSWTKQFDYAQYDDLGESELFYTDFLKAVTEGANFSNLTAQGCRLTDSVLAAERASVEGLFGITVDPARWNDYNLIFTPPNP